MASREEIRNVYAYSEAQEGKPLPESRSEFDRMIAEEKSAVLIRAIFRIGQYASPGSAVAQEIKDYADSVLAGKEN